jgi:hypothetical protein
MVFYGLLSWFGGLSYVLRFAEGGRLSRDARAIAGEGCIPFGKGADTTALVVGNSTIHNIPHGYG